MDLQQASFSTHLRYKFEAQLGVCEQGGQALRCAIRLRVFVRRIRRSFVVSDRGLGIMDVRSSTMGMLKIRKFATDQGFTTFERLTTSVTRLCSGETVE